MAPLFVMAPALDTPRLTLRAHIAADFDDSFAMWSDPATVRFIGGTPSTRERAWARLLNFGGLWPLLGFGYWAVRERATGAYVGEVGFADFHRGTDPSFEGEPEMGWVLNPAHHGKGYATEAAAAALAWADAGLPHPRIVCMIDPDNAASINVARKCGFADWTGTVFMGDPCLLFQRAILR